MQKGEVIAMPDYFKMYYSLFNSQTDAITILQKSGQDAEEMFVSSPEPEIKILTPKKTEEETEKE